MMMVQTGADKSSRVKKPPQDKGKPSLSDPNQEVLLDPSDRPCAGFYVQLTPPDDQSRPRRSHQRLRPSCCGAFAAVSLSTLDTLGTLGTLDELADGVTHRALMPQ